ncbi:hypothetical protein BN14_11293 [Rhizoctonia solani AG-1 IB]|uniref:Laminin domain-containing protein n=1 Tax=Thanatephorus cucumeris (strain AG1-IB / isolate 7/3/14) TaxID=1108050 RepID=M5CCH9_THACB|nr:hypothetical protein BN14_11293 [Rhizoctonia solani AG-1 IB]
MVGQSSWYPPGQLCIPPELPDYLKNIYDLKPIAGAPKDAEVIGIHAVVHAAKKVSEVPGMHDPSLLMGLADHLFSVQMARYRSNYSLITFPSDATYTPPSLPGHISISLEPISGAPSDEEIIKAQDALRLYQQFSHAPSMFDSHVNMELSQHLFDLQMARYMRCAGESKANPTPEESSRSEHYQPAGAAQANEGMATGTNNPGIGGNCPGTTPMPPLTPNLNIYELLERSNQLAERFNQLLERSNDLTERDVQSNNHAVAERSNQVVERFTQSIESTHQATEGSEHIAQRFNQLFEHFNQLTEQSNTSAQKSNELAERSNQLADKANQVLEQFGKPLEQIGDTLKYINKVLVGVQHAIVRSHKGNTVYAADCLVNEKGQRPIEGMGKTFGRKYETTSSHADYLLPLRIAGVSQNSRIYNYWLGFYLRFYNIGHGLRSNIIDHVVVTG